MKRSSPWAFWLYSTICIAWLLLMLVLEGHAGLLGASNLDAIRAAPTRAAPSSLATPRSTYQLQAPAEDIWHMYNAIEKDEGDLRIIFIALPALITLAIVLTPFLLRMFVASQVRTAVEQRVKEAKEALNKAEAEYNAKSKEFALRIEEVRALLLVRLAYLHWNLEDRDLAVFYARSAAATARAALVQEPGNERLRNFQQDADDSLAYYIAELSELEPLSIEFAEIARSRGLAMLNQLVTKNRDPNLDIETVDTCLFVIWVFRDSIAAANLSRSAELYRDWATALNSHRWKKRQRANYEKYKNYFDEYLARRRPEELRSA